MTHPRCLANTIKSIAINSRTVWTTSVFSLFFAVSALSGCALPDKPTRATLYDFGPGPQDTQLLQNVAAVAAMSHCPGTSQLAMICREKFSPAVVRSQ